MISATFATLALTAASLANAQYGPGGQYGGSGNNNGDSGNNGGSGNPYSNGGGNNLYNNNYGGISQYTTAVTAHATLATLSFAFLFPLGGILIRLTSWRGTWWIHALVQGFAYLLYIIAFGLGLYLSLNAPAELDLLSNAHPILGIMLFALLPFQPVLGWVHHVMFKARGQRTVWSYGHVWLGRIAITVGIINGGLGLRLAQRSGVWAPGNGVIIAYAVLAGGMWLVYAGSAVFGEVKRKRGGGDETAKGGYVVPRYQEVDMHDRPPRYA
ncbi:hypothetical protein LTR62_007931 [Meristemomyces frigidus]|uniref:Cytochrome b561 domain-containing protein n=1 Tax=Meristemomyces frigidus TaxID=1508187 RepID=A0AAN7YR90_9PEZI|nr:hypothetical protein LTR62_007931 [Meristemomyces frigidus]